MLKKKAEVLRLSFYTFQVVGAKSLIFAFRMEGLGQLQMVVVVTFGFSVLGNLKFGYLQKFWTSFEILLHFLIIFHNFGVLMDSKLQNTKFQNFSRIQILLFLHT